MALNDTQTSMDLSRLRWRGLILTLLGVIGILIVHWMVFFWVSTELRQGIIQRIFYIHVPSAWVPFFGYAVTAICGGLYLWLRDERLDMIAVSMAEGGLVFTTLILVSGPLWGRVAWNAWWAPEPRLMLTLLLWFIFLGYFLVRHSIQPVEKARRYSALVGILGALNIPLIHVSIYWYNILHPLPVILDQDEGPKAPADQLITFFLALGSFALVYFGLTVYRYALERIQRAEAAAALSTTE